MELFRHRGRAQLFAPKSGGGIVEATLGDGNAGFDKIGQRFERFGALQLDQQRDDIRRSLFVFLTLGTHSQTGGVERGAGRLNPGTGGCGLATSGKRIGLGHCPSDGGRPLGQQRRISPPLAMISFGLRKTERSAEFQASTGAM